MNGYRPLYTAGAEPDELFEYLCIRQMRIVTQVVHYYKVTSMTL